MVDAKTIKIDSAKEVELAEIVSEVLIYGFNHELDTLSTNRDMYPNDKNLLSSFIDQNRNDFLNELIFNYRFDAWADIVEIENLPDNEFDSFITDYLQTNESFWANSEVLETFENLFTNG
jgi:hypothetical protein